MWTVWDICCTRQANNQLTSWQRQQHKHRVVMTIKSGHVSPVHIFAQDSGRSNSSSWLDHWNGISPMHLLKNATRYEQPLRWRMVKKRHQMGTIITWNDRLGEIVCEFNYRLRNQDRLNGGNHTGSGIILKFEIINKIGVQFAVDSEMIEPFGRGWFCLGQFCTLINSDDCAKIRRSLIYWDLTIIGF